MGIYGLISVHLNASIYFSDLTPKLAKTLMMSRLLAMVQDVNNSYLPNPLAKISWLIWCRVAVASRLMVKALSSD